MTSSCRSVGFCVLAGISAARCEATSASRPARRGVCRSVIAFNAASRLAARAAALRSFVELRSLSMAAVHDRLIDDVAEDVQRIDDGDRPLPETKIQTGCIDLGTGFGHLGRRHDLSPQSYLNWTLPLRASSPCCPS